MASVVLPTPVGPTSSSACGGRSLSIARRTNASADGWPRVRYTPTSLGSALRRFRRGLGRRLGRRLGGRLSRGGGLAPGCRLLGRRLTVGRRRGLAGPRRRALGGSGLGGTRSRRPSGLGTNLARRVRRSRLIGRLGLG